MPDTHLPSPPDDQELYWYFGPQKRWVLLSTAEVIAILDADFCPRPDFLRHLAPYLASPEVGIVQSPQCFDTAASMGWIERAARAAQEWFFRWIQPSRDASDAAICCGSNAIYRRAAIDAADGFAELDHSEDMYTGLAVYEHGYRVLYVPVLLAKGTSPESPASFVNQQYRWAMGNLNLLTRRDLARMHAPWRMRLCYYEGVLAWLTVTLATGLVAFAHPVHSLDPHVRLTRVPRHTEPSVAVRSWRRRRTACPTHPARPLGLPLGARLVRRNSHLLRDRALLVEHPYPGYASLVPTFGAAAVILVGTLATSKSGLKLAGHEFGGLLSRRAPRAIGRLSYPWYLWHWPVLVFATAHYGTLSWPVQAACVLASAAPAYLTLVFIERPLRRSTIVTELPRRGLSVGAAAVVLALTARLLVGSVALRQLGTSAPVDLAGLPPGAVTGPHLLQSATTAIPKGMAVPNPVQARSAFPPDGRCEVAPAAVTSPACLFGPANANGRIVLLGDSHAGQWFSSILAIADQHDLQLEELVKQGCPLARLTVQNPQLGRAYTECDTWRAAMLARFAHEPKPKLIIISSLNQYSRNQACMTVEPDSPKMPLCT